MLLTPLLSLLAPHDCLGCGSEGSLICRQCARSLPPATPRCYRCMAGNRDFATCQLCFEETSVAAVFPVACYQGIAKELIWRLKFGRARAAAAEIGTLMAKQRLLPVADNTVVTYVPTATTHVRQRGYDQARLIARAFAAAYGLPCIPLLARAGRHQQIGANRAQRTSQLGSDFRAVHGSDIHGASILLIDDVVTTGATIDACASVLRAAGARRIHAMVFAQA